MTVAWLRQEVTEGADAAALPAEDGIGQKDILRLNPQSINHPEPLNHVSQDLVPDAPSAGEAWANLGALTPAGRFASGVVGSGWS